MRHNNALVYLTLSILSIIHGIMLFKGSQYYYNSFIPTGFIYAGIILFVAGWAGFGYVASILVNNWLPLIGALGVVGSTGFMKYNEIIGNKTSLMAMMTFIVSWVIVGVGLSQKKKSKVVYGNIIAVLLVILSMLIIIPWEEQHAIIAGPGIAYFVIAWVLVMCGLLNKYK